MQNSEPQILVEGTKTCSKCKTEQPFSNFHVASKEKSGRVSSCKACCSKYHKEAYAANPEKFKLNADPEAARLRAAEWYRANRERALATSKLRYEEKKANRVVVPKVPRTEEDIAAGKAKRKAQKAANNRKHYEQSKGKVLAQCKAWEAANPEKVKAARARYRYVNREEIARKLREYRNLNLEKYRETRKKWLDANRAKDRKSKQKYALANLYRIKHNNAAWATSNPGKRAEMCANRRRRLRVMPWTDRTEILKLYAEAQRLTELTGVTHEVDHAFPIHSKTISGLHVHQNLRVVSRSLNRAKSDKLPGHFAKELWNPTGLDVFHESTHG